MWTRLATYAAIGMSLLLIVFLAFGPALAAVLLSIAVLFWLAMKAPRVAFALSIAILAMLVVDVGIAWAQDAPAAASDALPTLIPAKYEQYFIILNLVLTIGSRLAPLTKTDIDDKAISIAGKLLNFLGGHWGSLNGDPSKPAPK